MHSTKRQNIDQHKKVSCISVDNNEQSEKEYKTIPF